jgi:hypothetical protein
MLSKLIFWEFPRGSVSYDIVVVLIVMFIFLTPRDVFRDQPRAASIVMLPAQQGFLLEPGLLSGVPAEAQARRATALVQDRFKTRDAVTRVEPVYEEEELTGYMAFTER